MARCSCRSELRKDISGPSSQNLVTLTCQIASLIWHIKTIMGDSYSLSNTSTKISPRRIQTYLRSVFFSTGRGVYMHEICFCHLRHNHRIMSIRIEHNNCISQHVRCVCIFEKITVISTVPAIDCPTMLRI